VVILPLHGTGGDETSLIELGDSLAQGSAVLSPRGTVLEAGRWPRFFKRFAEGQYDYEDLVVRLDAFVEWLQAARNHYGIPTDARILAVGYSNGANFAGACLLRHPGVIESAVLLRPALDMPRESIAANLPEGPFGQVVLRMGANDPVCPPSMGERLAQQLLGQNAYRVTQTLVPGAGHDLRNEDIVATADHFRSWISPQ
jgi:phospholipase/carboxylesterase